MKTVVASKRILAALLLLLPGALAAQDVPIRNWDVPRDGLSKLALVQPTVFAPVSPPCRLDDSRVSSGGPGPIPASGTRDYDFIPGGGVSCGTLPANVVALSVFLTVVGPSGPGFLYAYPTGAPPGSPTSIVNYNAGELKNAAAVIPVDPGTGSFTIGVGGAGTDLIIDLNGVFYNNLQFQGELSIYTSNNGGWAILGENQSSSRNSIGVLGHAPGAGMVHGVVGVLGANAAAGASAVKGTSPGSAAGVHGTSGTGLGVHGASGSGWGIYGRSETSTGIVGSSPTHEGVAGVTTGTNLYSAGVAGQADGPVAAASGISHAGVKGMSHGGRGVLGIVDTLTGRAVSGHMVTSPNGTAVTSGHLGVSATTGVLSNGDIMATGPKFFVEPHPTDPAKMIRYVSLEGNEAGTYFRGKGKFERGLARIQVPEDFRIVTDAEGLSIQVTPLGDMASVGVVRIDLDEIVVKGSRNVEFFYTVNGVRKAYKDIPTVVENDLVFVPERPDAAMPLWLSEEAKARLIRNGTYNADGSVNRDTAKRLGWDKAWAKEKR